MDGKTESKISYWKFVAAFAGIVLVVLGIYFVWNNYFKYDQVKVHEEAERAYIAAMTSDTYGGKTPQETLNLFVAALRSGDVELASKYFLLDENLSRERWIAYLSGIKEKGFLSRLADDLQNEARPAGSLYDGNFQFELFNDDGTVGLLVNLQFNKHSSVWKIESL